MSRLTLATLKNGAKEHPEKHLFHVFGEIRPWAWWIMGNPGLGKTVFQA
ncbi:MAG: hypothetical protein LBB60_02885 [Desulfovibrio sp.]|jgi:hypothetical protein|nr:hypothetical protein [Desulfovibrio sp.]